MNFNIEKMFGITEFANTNPGFHGIIKQRFSDFMVNEISSSGEVVHLTSQYVPAPPTSEENVSTMQQHVEISDYQMLMLRVLSGQMSVNEIKPSALLHSTCNNDYESNPKICDVTSVNIDATEFSKEKRKSIHQFIKSHFPGLVSSTKEKDLKKIISVIKQENVPRTEKRSTWPKSLSHVHFVMYKENLDTMEAMNILASKLRLNVNKFCYAGTKDRRAKTSQMVSVRHIPPKNIFSASNGIAKIHVGNFCFRHKEQKLGQAQGNHFRVILREVDASDQVIREATDLLRERGFINYFGLQRFGSSHSTQAVGLAILRDDWRQAIDVILEPRKYDSPDLLEAKRVWKDKSDAVSAFACIKNKKKSSVEIKLLRAIADDGNRILVSSIEQIPRNLKMMYLHAYQSQVWNRVVSQRIKKFGLSVVKGDLIRVGKSESSSIDISEIDDAHSVTQDDACEVDESRVIKQNVRFVTEEEVNSVDLSQILLPLPGFSVKFPQNEMKDWYDSFLAEDGLSMQSFKSKYKSFSLPGAYRHIVVKVDQIESSVCYYDDPSAPLLASDIDILNKVDVLKNRKEEGRYKAVTLTFSLPSSAYATMLLRELLKAETSGKFQDSLTKSHQDENQSSSKRANDNEESLELGQRDEAKRAKTVQ